ncbi:MAG: hypothetical protein U0166_13585 [Acidobacteriota bacterium]
MPSRPRRRRRLPQLVTQGVAGGAQELAQGSGCSFTTTTTGAEREELVGYVFERAGIALDAPGHPRIHPSLLRRGLRQGRRLPQGWILGNSGKLPSAADLATPVADDRTPDLSARRQLQTLHAAPECTLNSLIPDETLRDRDKIEAEIQLLIASGLSY